MRKSEARGVRARPIRVEDYPVGCRTDLSLPIHQDARGEPVSLPMIVVRGRYAGPVVGICAAIHGNELNGIKIIHHLLDRAQPELLHGAIVCAPVANVPAFHARQRRFPADGVDLNHVFPGKLEGRPAEQYARSFLTTFLPPLDFLIDIHTASEGRINSMYVRADLHSEVARRMALEMNPEIVLHGRSGDGTLRSAARRQGVPAITVEAGNPSVFQGVMVLEGLLGILNVLAYLEVLRTELPSFERTPVLCRSSKWLRTRAGGLLDCRFELRDHVRKGQLLAEVRDAFGHLVQSYRAPRDGVVIGMSRRPTAVPGTRYCHLGDIGEPEPPRRRGSTGAFSSERLEEGA